MKALIDTNVLLDDVLAREPFAADAHAIVEACANREFFGYISAITPLNAFYVARRLAGTAQARVMVGLLLQLFEICAIDRHALQTAYESGENDLEDATQAAAAEHDGVDLIVTRDVKGFSHTSIATLTPAEFLARLRTGTPGF